MHADFSNSEADCASDPCQNGGTCVGVDNDGVFAYTCSCLTGYTGDNCEQGN